MQPLGGGERRKAPVIEPAVRKVYCVPLRKMPFCTGASVKVPARAAWPVRLRASLALGVIPIARVEPGLSARLVPVMLAFGWSALPICNWAPLSTAVAAIVLVPPRVHDAPWVAASVVKLRKSFSAVPVP